MEFRDIDPPRSKMRRKSEKKVRQRYNESFSLFSHRAILFISLVPYPYFPLPKLHFHTLFSCVFSFFPLQLVFFYFFFSFRSHFNEFCVPVLSLLPQCCYFSVEGCKQGYISLDRDVVFLQFCLEKLHNSSVKSTNLQHVFDAAAVCAQETLRSIGMKYLECI